MPPASKRVPTDAELREARRALRSVGSNVWEIQQRLLWNARVRVLDADGALLLVRDGLLERVVGGNGDS